MFTPNSTFHSLCVKSVLRETWLPQNPAGSKWRWFQPAFVLQAAWLRERKLQHLCQFPLGNLDTEHRVFLWNLSSGPEPSMSKPTQITMKRCIGCYCLNWRWQPVSASSRIFPTIFPLTYLRFHQFASIHQSCTAKRHCTDWRPLHPVWSSVVLVQQSQRKLLSDVALLLQSARALWLIISSWILGSTDSLRLMRTCVCGQHGMSKKKQNSAKTELNSSFKVSIPQAPCPGVFEALYVSPPLWPKDTNMFDAFDPEKDRTLWLFVEGYALSHI